jgi:PIN domain nuclease of toxin-antitoxin system
LTIAAVADTHTAVWYLSSDPRLSSVAELFIDETAHKRNKIAISSISLGEMVYLVEKQRIPVSAFESLLQALADPEHVFTEAFFTSAVVRSMQHISRPDVPDMPDRMIAATAIHLGVPAITRDGRMRASNLTTIW